jgi:hypothetical protein
MSKRKLSGEKCKIGEILEVIIRTKQRTLEVMA